MNNINLDLVKQRSLIDTARRGRFQNVFTKRIHPSMPLYIPKRGGTHKYGTIAEDGLYFDLDYNEYFGIYRSNFYDLKEVRYSEESPIYYYQEKDYPELYFRNNGTICHNDEISIYTLKDKKDKKFVVDWVCQTVIKQKGKGKLKPSKYLLSTPLLKKYITANRYITIEPNGKFKITFK